MRNIRKKNLKNMGRSALSFILIISLVCSQIPQSAYAADQTEEIPAYYGMMSLAGSIQLYCNTADINKNIYSGGDFTCSGTEFFRINDTEYKIIENYNLILKGDYAASGTITIVSEREVCLSCDNVIKKFSSEYKNIEIRVVDSLGNMYIIKEGVVQ